MSAKPALQPLDPGDHGAVVPAANHSSPGASLCVEQAQGDEAADQVGVQAGAAGERSRSHAAVGRMASHEARPAVMRAFLGSKVEVGRELLEQPPLVVGQSRRAP